MNKNSFTYEFWLCEFAKRNLWLSCFPTKKQDPEARREDYESYEDLHHANQTIIDAGELIWKKIFHKEFNKKNYKELIYLYAPRKASITRYFKELSSNEILLVEKLDQEIQLIEFTSNKYGFLLCDLLFNTHENTFSSSEILDFYIALDREDTNITPNKSKNCLSSQKNERLSNIFFPTPFPDGKKIFPSLHNTMQYDREKDLITLPLPQITDIDCNFEEFKNEIVIYLTTLRYEHLKDTHLKIIDCLTKEIINLFLQDALQEEDESLSQQIFLACDNDLCYSLNDQECYNNKRCRDIYFSWLKNPKELFFFDKKQCKQPETKEFRCTCCLAHEIKNFIRDNKANNIPINILIKNKKNAYLLTKHAKINDELNNINSTIQKFREKQMFGRERKKDKIESIKNSLLSLFIWDLSHVHGVETKNLWKELLKHAKQAGYDGFDNKSDEWILKATTTNITHINQCIKEMKIITKR